MGLTMKNFCCKIHRHIVIHGIIIAVLLLAGSSTVLATDKRDPAYVQTYIEGQNAVFKRIFYDPKRARELLSVMLADEGQVPDSVLSKTYNILGVYFGVVNELDSALWSFDKAMAYIPKDSPRIVSLMSNKAIVYRKMKRFNEGLALMEQAEKLAVALKDSMMLPQIYGEQASLYSVQQMNNLAVKRLLLSIDIMAKNKERYKTLLYKERQKLANLYSKLGNYDFAEAIYRYIIPEFKKAGENDTYFVSMINLGDILYSKKEYGEAREWIEKGLDSLMKFPNEEYKLHGKERLAAVEEAEGNKNEARALYQEVFTKAKEIKSVRTLFFALQLANFLNKYNPRQELIKLIEEIKPGGWMDEFVINTSLDEQVNYYRLLGDVYSDDIGDFASSTTFYKKAYALRDSLFRIENTSETLEIQAKYQRDLENQEILIQDQQSSMRTLINVVSILSLLVLVVFFVGRAKMFQNKAKLASLQLNLLSSEKELLDQKLLMEKEINELKEKVIQEQSNDLMVKDLENMQLNQQLREVVEKMEGSGNNMGGISVTLERSRDAWGEIIRKFQQLNPQFLHNLGQYGKQLTKGDLEFCSMVRMNMSNKEIARLLNITIESVHTKKYRLMKKLHLPDDTDFYQWIMSM